MNDKPVLMLLHGVTMSGAAWNDVVPLLAERFDVIAPTAAGHRGGPALAGVATIAAVTDAAERELDERGLDAVHIAGNSMGGWMAVELARRGRARSVCAFSPAGLWKKDEMPGASRATLIRTKRLADATRRLAPALMRFGLARRIAMRDIAVHGDSMTPQQAVRSFQDLVGCEAAYELLNTRESMDPLLDLPCPVTVAWAAHDRIFPSAEFVPIARQRLPRARFVTVPGVGHVPMIDDPVLCARTIVDSIENQAG
ncbi:alpha/beta hydrolase [Rhodococcus sp. 06-412-2C]|uniref:alpha/beta fold hydrolase n=1 Tax=unclassified Rhodococcus (in: high G+C Gram-positive bacteria) TaxID=192944 RepID=UPI000B9B0A11|nr:MULTISPECIES: alpha/beta hydrolase [unclassified Rhodococcus (in: high G+C Gram-positive bacteria)]OZC87032.1 alpha/beta hydrolase [Rhodococcus sp. 06-412-2C]OZC99916.1 alpha/beta hydrolase [Rhodococcus sp. 06-412-2B]